MSDHGQTNRSQSSGGEITANQACKVGATSSRHNQSLSGRIDDGLGGLQGSWKMSRRRGGACRPPTRLPDSGLSGRGSCDWRGGWRGRPCQAVTGEAKPVRGRACCQAPSRPPGSASSGRGSLGASTGRRRQRRCSTARCDLRSQYAVLLAWIDNMRPLARRDAGDLCVAVAATVHKVLAAVIRGKRQGKGKSIPISQLAFAADQDAVGMCVPIHYLLIALHTRTQTLSNTFRVQTHIAGRHS